MPGRDGAWSQAVTAQVGAGRVVTAGLPGSASTSGPARWLHGGTSAGRGTDDWPTKVGRGLVALRNQPSPRKTRTLPPIWRRPSAPGMAIPAARNSCSGTPLVRRRPTWPSLPEHRRYPAWRPVARCRPQGGGSRRCRARSRPASGASARRSSAESVISAIKLRSSSAVHRIQPASYLTARRLTGRMSGARASRSADTWVSAAGIWPLMCAVRASPVAKVSKMP